MTHSVERLIVHVCACVCLCGGACNGMLADCFGSSSCVALTSLPACLTASCVRQIQFHRYADRDSDRDTHTQTHTRLHWQSTASVIILHFAFFCCNLLSMAEHLKKPQIVAAMWCLEEESSGGLLYCNCGMFKKTLYNMQHTQHTPHLTPWGHRVHSLQCMIRYDLVLYRYDL